MAVTALGRLAAAAPAAVFPAVGPGWRDRVEELALRPGLELVATPRHATVLLVAGDVPARDRDALARVHDQLPHPRATLWWGATPGWGATPRWGATPGWGAAVERGPDGGERGDGGGEEPGVTVAVDADPVPRLATLAGELLTGGRPSETHRLADRPPHPWRGLGDHGQGGEGMMGGTPYGRPMAMTGDDLRDGLALDRLAFTVGPFFPHLPPGLVLRLVLQGDVVQQAEVVSGPYPQPPASPLRRISRLLRATGAPSLAERALRLAVAEPAPAAPQVAAFSRRLRLALPRALEAGEPLAIEHLPHRLPGMEWGRAVATLAGLPAPPFASPATAPLPAAPPPDRTPSAAGSPP